ncbi:bcl-2/adenovirus E1B 19 kDa-interacting protein 2-like protein isoform X3 [Falco peregrinus]|uniref:bcl-2/adenovirus E1B 19 kDa-interacting protein 2-like protein isoform X3 n=1 Tax=Falco peregrinus TaxID=8954 RepID=UPI002478F60F|nr:bcl-2/adenovirus E1B 19 kDa-interacting protein 2-like protein isoform X3 [Falco peregrinus]
MAPTLPGGEPSLFLGCRPPCQYPLWVRGAFQGGGGGGARCGRTPKSSSARRKPVVPPRAVASAGCKCGQTSLDEPPVPSPEPFICGEPQGERGSPEVMATRMATVMATGDGLDLSEEWQDEDFPGPLPEECLGAGGALRRMRRRLPALERTESTDRSPDASIDLDLDALETPTGSDGFEWEEELPHAWAFAEGAGSRWEPDTEDEQPEESVDLSVVEPYSRVLSHGGYDSEGFGAILLFAACHLPDSSIPRYSYVMENLLRYIMGTLERTVADRYILVCLSGAAARGQIPSFSWMKRCYRAMDRRLRKSLQAVIIVHPTCSW